MTVRELLGYGVGALVEAGIEEAESDAKLLCEFVLKTDYSAMLLAMGNTVEEDKVRAYKQVIERRKTRVPCQYITKTQNFMGYDFYVDEGVLVPRPETELLVEEAVKLAGDRDGLSVLDLCTGSGCIGISYYLERRKRGYYDSVLLADISLQAVSVAAKNRDRLAPEGQLVKSDLFEGIESRFDMILSNPPYIKTEEIETLMPEVRDHEPQIALDGKKDGLYFYRCITEEAEAYLNDNGTLLFEIGCDQMEACEGLLVASDFRDIIKKQDYAGLDRMIGGRKNV